MKAPFPADGPGMGSQPHAFFLHSGAYGSFVLCTIPSDDINLLAPMEDGDLWGSECVQLTESAVFFRVGSDAINQALCVYLNASGKDDPPERSLNATFVSRGEQVYLESLINMIFGAGCDQFYLPEGEYEVRLLSWNLMRARDNFDADPKFFFENSHHELHFINSADCCAIKRTVHDGEANEHASFPDL